MNIMDYKNVCKRKDHRTSDLLHTTFVKKLKTGSVNQSPTLLRAACPEPNKLL